MADRFPFWRDRLARAGACRKIKSGIACRLFQRNTSSVPDLCFGNGVLGSQLQRQEHSG